MTKSPKPLAYRFPEKVTFRSDNKSLTLVRDFPLKSLRVHKAWKPVFAFLSEGSFASLDEIRNICPDIPVDKLELFFDDLVRKGFLEQEGTSEIIDYPTVSIIIPVKDRPDEIKACLSSLKNLEYPAEKLDIIVVDDASTDHTPLVIKEFDVNLISLKENRQAPYCRNLGAKEAKGEILAFIDSDCTASPGWLTELIPAFKDIAIGAVGGEIDSFYNKSLLDKYEKVKSSLVMGSHSKRSKEDEKFFYVPSCNMLVRKSCFFEVNGFNKELIVGEDVDLCWRLQNKGYPVEFRPSGRIFHKHRNKLWAFCRRRFDYGTSEPLLQIIHQSRRKQLVFPPAASLFWFVLILALLVPFWPLLILCPAVAVSDVMMKHISTKKKRLPIVFTQHIKAVIRTYGAFFYHCCTIVSRYYLFLVILLLPAAPLWAAFIIALHVISGAVQYYIYKPGLNITGFFLFYSLEQLSYQAGVWYNSFKLKNFDSVNPLISFKKKNA